MARRKLPKPAAIQYIIADCRKSLDDEDRQIESLDDQEHLNREHYGKLPQEVKTKHPLHVIKNSESGFTPDMRSADEIIAMADAGKVYGLQAIAVNRLGRNPEVIGKIVQRVADGRIPYIETTDGRRYTGKDTNTIVMLCLEGAIGWKDSADKGKMIFDRMLLRTKEGKHMSRKPFGFKPHHEILPNGEVLRTTVDDEERLPHLLTMFRLAHAGYTYPDLERWAEREKICQRDGKPLQRQTIAKILNNPYYKGSTKFAGVVYEGSHAAVISPDLWQGAQDAIAGRRRNSGRKKEETLRSLFLFGDTIHCGECGGVMSPYRVVKKKTGMTHIYYECKNRHSECRQSIRQQTLEGQENEEGLREQFDAMLDKFSISDSVLVSVREKLLTLHKEKSAARRTAVERLQKDYLKVEAELTAQVAALAKAKALGVEDIVETEIKKLVNKRQSIKDQLDAAHDEGTDWITKVIGNFKLIELVREAILHGSPTVKGAVVRAVCSNLKVHDKKLIPEPRSPFKEAMNQEKSVDWWS